MDYKFVFICTTLLLIACPIALTQSPTTLYEVYNEGGLINPNGPALVAEGPTFSLNGKDFHILSGAIHYFRVIPEYWQDRIRKLKACGCNTLETYIPWNLHEERPGQFNFADMLDIRHFLQIAQEEDLFVILRPGPYICSEWEYGGLPSWLLRSTDMIVRTSDQNYTDAIDRYYQQLMPLIADLQFTNGGSIIAVQVENEYGSYEVDDQPYLEFLRQTMTDLGIVELFVNSDSCNTDECRVRGTLPGLLMTSNFQGNVDFELDRLLRLQPDRPLMVMEYWTGWFDHWEENHHVVDTESYSACISQLLERNSSINLYMFHGGTSFGFMNGANSGAGLLYMPDVTSYDYDAPLSESGDYTSKYNATRELYLEFSKGKLWDVPIPEPPPETSKAAYGSVTIEKYLTFDDVLSLITPLSSPDTVPMELLDLSDNSGQLFGYIIYRNTIDIPQTTATLTINGRIRDYGHVILDDVIVGTFKWENQSPSVTLTPSQSGSHDLKIVVQNSGRVNFGYTWDLNVEGQSKGIKDPVDLDSTTLTDWTIYALDFNQNFLDQLTTQASWRNFVSSSTTTYPGLMSATLNIEGTPQDTFLYMTGWTKGFVIINNFLLGRYWNVGPQASLYVPAPILKQGANTIYIFEITSGADSFVFQDIPNLGPTNNFINWLENIFRAFVDLLPFQC